MTTQSEAAANAAQEIAMERLKKRRSDTDPKMTLLHHIAASQHMKTSFAVTLHDGTTYDASMDFIFIDGISIVHEGDRIYFPLTAIRSIRVYSPVNIDHKKLGGR